MDIDTIVLPVQENLAQFEANFQKLLHSNVPLADKVVRYIAGRKGKRLRPLIVFLAAKLHGDINDQTMKMGYVVELLHTATLVHDDVVDNSDARRGSPTINHLWDNKISVLVGDFLFSKTLTTLLDIQNHTALEVFSKTTKLITEGELIQIERADDWHIDQSAYLDLIIKKTASLFGAACQLGALSVQASAEEQKQMQEFGKYFGMAFQIHDDILDYNGDLKLLGKPVGNDIRENKVTIPMIYALRNASADSRDRMQDLLDKTDKTEEDIGKLIALVEQEGGVTSSKQLASAFSEKAFEILNQYPSSATKQSLTELLDFSLNRQN